MKLQSRVCEILEIEQPIVLAGPAVPPWLQRYPIQVALACSARQPAGLGSCGSGFVKPAK